MQIDMVPLAELRAADYNPRTIAPEVLQRLADEMKEFGFVEPIVCNRTTGNIVGGHQRARAAEVAGIDPVPVHWVTLDEGREKALNLALNKLSGDWDDDKLKELLGSMEDDDLLLTGFDDAEIAGLLAGDDGDLRYLEDFDASPKPAPQWILIETDDCESAEIMAAFNALPLMNSRIEVS